MQPDEVTERGQITRSRQCSPQGHTNYYMDTPMWTTGSSFKNTMTIQTALIIILEGTIGSCSSLNQRRDCSVECTSSVRE